MSARPHPAVGLEARRAKGWLRAHRYLLLRRASQIGFLALFLTGPWIGLWIVEGTLAGSLTLGVLPLTDPFVALQSLVAGHWPAATALLGAGIVLGAYALVGGRAYCAWVCPINPVADAAHWLHRRLGLTKGWSPRRQTRLWLMATALAVSALGGTIAWEIVNPITMLHRGLVFGIGAAWVLVALVFVFDLVVSRHGWCGHLCPVGAFYGLVGRASLLRVGAVDRAACNDCMDCYAVCPESHVIAPALKGGPGSSPVILAPDCTNCGRCIDVCAEDVFAFTHRFRDRGAGPAPAVPERTAA